LKFTKNALRVLHSESQANIKMTDATNDVPPPQPNYLYEQFRRVEQNFNKNYLKTLWQVMEIVADEPDQKDVRHYNALKEAYTHWYHRIEDDPNDMTACIQMHDAIGDHNDMLKIRDTQLFTINGDLLGNMFAVAVNAKGKVKPMPLSVDTPYLFDMLDDGLDGGVDAKEHFWSTLSSLYRLCVLICIYLKMPLVKEIIDIILLSNNAINPQNFASTMMNEFKGSTPTSRRLRRLLAKLMRQKDSDFTNILNSFQKVISTMAPEASQSSGPTDSTGPSGQDRIVTLQAATGASIDEATAFYADVDAGTTLEDACAKHGFDPFKIQAQAPGASAPGAFGGMPNGLGETFQSMMNALQTGDESKMQEVLSKAGAGFNMQPEEFNRMKEEMDSLEKSLVDEVDEDDASHSDVEESKE